jgi:hypothetical protein
MRPRVLDLNDFFYFVQVVVLGARTLIEEVSRRRRAVVRYLVEDRPFGRVLLKI